MAARLRHSMVVSCEHAGNAVPARYRPLFAQHRALLAGHRAYDRGALDMARALARAFGAPLAAATTTRLLVDLNRSQGHPQLYSVVTRGAGPELRREIFERHYLPHRRRVEALITGAIETGRPALHLACHSFTATLAGVERNADVGLLYDPERGAEAALCAAWQREIRMLAPDLRVRRNYPYLGRTDGFTTWWRRRHPQTVYLGIELELNQATIAQPRARAQRARVIEA
ncbi:MAG: N-formylglutamate amidohydrolase, partial [Burkholderiales bacterium]|nr:N-formylglutamate amidohydrolase [Burkholderiales bacterium]